MSVSKWAYDPEVCNDQICPGDCDLCNYKPEEDEEDDEEEEERAILAARRGEE